MRTIFQGMTMPFGRHLMPGHRKRAETNFRNAETQTGPWKPAAMDQRLADQGDLAQASTCPQKQ